MQEYAISPHSLFAAVSVDLTEGDIVRDLEVFSKTKVPANTIHFIHEVTQSFEKVRLVLKRNKYSIESNDESVLQMLLRDPVIGGCRVEETDELRTENAAQKRGLVIPGRKDAAGVKEAIAQVSRTRKRNEDDSMDDEHGGREAEEKIAELLQEEDDDNDAEQVLSFEIEGENIQLVQEHCNVKLNLPLMEEYDFHADNINANLDFDLRPNMQIRYYQEHAFSKMFANGRASSGIIVLPCGAGNTFVGITAACTVRKSTIVLCNSAISAVQWKEEFKK